MPEHGKGREVRIYLSSTYEDLKEYREAAAKAIRGLKHECVGMEDYRASPDYPVDYCLRDVASCQAYVGIIGMRYGFVPTGYDRSITELEYRKAREMNVTALLFLADPKADGLEGAGEHDPRLDALRSEVSEAHICGFFTTPENLRALVAESLGNISGDGITERPIVGTCPSAADMFKDREEKSEELETFLKDPRAKLVCIVGRPGMGKTALLAKACRKIENGELNLVQLKREIGADGIAYIYCKGSRVTLEYVFGEIGELLEKKGRAKREEVMDLYNRPGESVRSKTAKLLNYLQGDCYLLVFDNLESLLNEDSAIADDQLRQFFESCVELSSPLKILATSREEVFLESGLHIIELEEGLPLADAVDFLRDLDPQGRLRLRDADRDVLERIAEACRCVPLALEEGLRPDGGKGQAQAGGPAREEEGPLRRKGG